MGATGIISHAPFIPVASSLPVVAPILAIQALNTAAMMQQFEQVDRKLDHIKSQLDSLIARIEATHAGRLLAASETIDEIFQQYEIEGQFSTDMIMRLAVAERDVRSLSIRFRQLTESITDGDFAVPDADEKIQQANYDAYAAMLASFLELRTSYLRVRVDMQENPLSVNMSTEKLKERIDDSVGFWERLLTRSESLKEMISETESELADMSWSERNLPGGRASRMEQQLKQLRKAYTSTIESQMGTLHNFSSVIHSVKQVRDAFEEVRPDPESSPTLVYWEDETGKHSFVTDKLGIS